MAGYPLDLSFCSNSLPIAGSPSPNDKFPTAAETNRPSITQSAFLQRSYSAIDRILFPLTISSLDIVDISHAIRQSDISIDNYSLLKFLHE
jgi:hypothetical protein